MFARLLHSLQYSQFESTNGRRCFASGFVTDLNYFTMAIYSKLIRRSDECFRPHNWQITTQFHFRHGVLCTVRRPTLFTRFSAVFLVGYASFNMGMVPGHFFVHLGPVSEGHAQNISVDGVLCTMLEFFSVFQDPAVNKYLVDTAISLTEAFLLKLCLYISLQRSDSSRAK